MKLSVALLLTKAWTSSFPWYVMKSKGILSAFHFVMYIASLPNFLMMDTSCSPSRILIASSLMIFFLFAFVSFFISFQSLSFLSFCSGSLTDFVFSAVLSCPTLYSSYLAIAISAACYHLASILNFCSCILCP
jgi:hypothetical protein